MIILSLLFREANEKKMCRKTENNLQRDSYCDRETSILTDSGGAKSIVRCKKGVDCAELLSSVTTVFWGEYICPLFGGVRLIKVLVNGGSIAYGFDFK